MPRNLRSSDGKSYTVGGTDTLTLARRMLAAGDVINARMPDGYDLPSPMQIMMQLYVSEEEARYSTSTNLGRPDPVSQTVTLRWLSVLEEAGLVERKGDLAALTPYGLEHVIGTLEALFDAQRKLDRF